MAAISNEAEGAAQANSPATNSEVPEGVPAKRMPPGLAAWRKAERERLIATRLALSADTRTLYAARVADGLDMLLGSPAGLTVSIYWPFRGEPDLRGWLETIVARGGRGALPVVVQKGAPLVFRAWRRGEPLVPGVWKIPVPRDGAEVRPDVVIAPVVGFDSQAYRLGYGGGFFDRTLAATARRPRVFGVGYALAELPSIQPQPHDIPMDVVVTERGVSARSAGNASQGL